MIREAKDPVPPSYFMSMNNLPEAPSSHCESEQLVCHQHVVDQPIVASKNQPYVKHGEASIRSEISCGQSNAKRAETSKARRNEATRSKSTTAETVIKAEIGRTVRKPEKLSLWKLKL